MKLLIPGGAGYIGSHMVKYAQEKNHEVVVLDNFSTGHEWAIKDCEVLKVNLLDEERLQSLLKGRSFDGVIHFAAKSLVAESVVKPDLYYRNNVVGTLNLVNEMIRNNIENLVFSSTAAIFGNPVSEKISENHPKKPINPYGKSKLMVEDMLSDISISEQINITALRYFNAAGADLSGNIGEAHDPETHLIPNILNTAPSEKGKRLSVFGNEYDTNDGTCIRDYVHVTDLAQAHLLGLIKNKGNQGLTCYNLGNGEGFSVLDVIKSCEKVLGKTIEYDVCDKRDGDPAVLVSDSTKAIQSLGWKPEFKSLELIVSSAWQWHQKLANIK
jgi:UDP-glucose 4-epimerase